MIVLVKHKHKQTHMAHLLALVSKCSMFLHQMWTR